MELHLHGGRTVVFVNESIRAQILTALKRILSRDYTGKGPAATTLDKLDYINAAFTMLHWLCVQSYCLDQYLSRTDWKRCDVATSSYKLHLRLRRHLSAFRDPGL